MSPPPLFHDSKPIQVISRTVVPVRCPTCISEQEKSGNRRALLLYYPRRRRGIVAWSERMNAAVDYIEENLAGEIDLNEAAKRACCSVFHFQRMFFAVNGITPAEYTRRRRLTLAATELSSGNVKVIDIAMKYGYNSPDSFTRAFRNLHGVTPQTAREPGVKLTAYPRVSFHIELKGGDDMDYRIVEKPAFDVVGKAKKFTTAGGENIQKIPQFWDEFIKAKHHDVLMKLTGGKTGPVTGADSLGVCYFSGDEKDMQEFSYGIGVEKPDKPVPTGFDVIHIPEATWAIFESVGPMPKAIQDVTVKIFQEWFPSTGYEHDNKPELEVYLPGDPNKSDYRCQVWMPIVKKG
jgi:AraC family transcriptional regulator